MNTADSLPLASPRDPFFEQPEEELDLSRYWEILRRRRRLLLVSLAAGLIGAALLYVMSPKQYRASTLLLVERKTPALLAAGVSVDVDSWADAQTFYPTQYRLLQSRGLAERVVRNLNLAADPTFNPSRNGPFASTASLDDEQVLAALARRLQAGLEVKPLRDTRLVEISFTAPNPELAARIANGVAEAYIDWGVETRFASVGRASSFLASQIEALKREIQEKEAQLQAYSRRTDIVALDPNSNVTLQRLEGLNKDYVEAVSQRIQKEARYKELMSSQEEAVADLVSGGLVGQLRAEQLKLERDYATKLNTFKPDWPAMQELKARIDKGRQHLENLIQETVSNAREQAKAEYQAALRREQSLAQELAKQKAEAMQLNSVAVEYNNLKVEVSTRRSLLDELLRKQAETEVSSRLGNSRESNILVVDRALPPASAFRPSLKRNLALGGALGLFLGIGLVFFAEYLDRRVKSPEEVDRLVGLPLLATIPDVSSDGGYTAYGYGSKQPKVGASSPADDKFIELVPHLHPKLATAEAYRTLRTALLLSSAGGLRSVVISSAVAGEGKTVTAANLAVVLAQLGREVVLVDGDLRRSRQHQIFAVSNRFGLANYLAGDAPVENIIFPTRIPKLALVPAGPHPPNPAELLSSALMSDLLTILQQRFQFVVVDTPPVLPVTDASIVSAHCGGLVLCVGANQVLREELRSCWERLQIAGVRVLGVVVNRFRPERSRYGYGSYYAAYDHYVEQESQSQPRGR